MQRVTATVAGESRLRVHKENRMLGDTAMSKSVKHAISLRACHRLLLEKGAERATKESVVALQYALEHRARVLVFAATTFAKHAGRRTIYVSDLDLALDNHELGDKRAN